MLSLFGRNETSDPHRVRMVLLFGGRRKEASGREVVQLIALDVVGRSKSDRELVVLFSILFGGNRQAIVGSYY